MVFVGHLDLMRMMDRACRRAGLPVTADKSPYRSRPLITTALPLQLGATSFAEHLEIMLTRSMDLQEVVQVWCGVHRAWRDMIYFWGFLCM